MRFSRIFSLDILDFMILEVFSNLHDSITLSAFLKKMDRKKSHMFCNNWTVHGAPYTSLTRGSRKEA